MSKDETAGWFDEADRVPSASAKFKDIGDTVQGKIVDKFKIDYVKVGEKDPEKDRDGNVVQQLVIVLQTDLRNWDSVAKIPVDKDGKQRPASEDNGRRSIYARKFTNIYAAIGKALKAAEAADLEIGGDLAVQYYKDEDTGKPSPLKHFRGKYKAPVVDTSDEDWGEPGGNASASAEPGTKPSTASQPADDEPPF